jgi:hypothetical protein
MARGRKRKAGDTRSFGQFKKEQGLPPANRPISQSTAGSGYQAGGDSITNYSPKDQQKIYDFVGGKDNFIEQASGIASKYPRGTDIQKFLDRINLYNQGIMAGGTTYEDVTGLERLNLVNKGLKDESGATILSLTRPELTATPPTLSEFAKDIVGGAGSMLGAVGEKVLSGGVTGELLQFIKDKYEGGKQKLNRIVNPPGEQMKENLPKIIENPLYNITEYDPISVSDMDPSQMTAEASGIQKVYDNIKRIQDLSTQYGLDNIQIDPFNLNKGIGYENQFMFNDMPIDYGINIAPGGNFGFNLGLQY